MPETIEDRLLSVETRLTALETRLTSALQIIETKFAALAPSATAQSDPRLTRALAVIEANFPKIIFEQ